MGRRIFEDANGEFGGKAEIVYSTPAAVFYQLIDPTNLYVVGGRATGKTTNIIADRALRIVKALSGAYFAFVGDTYANLLSNTVPSMIKGWNDLGLEEGKDYVTNQEPPKHFKKPYKKPLSYKHTISMQNGSFFKLVSMDVVSSAAGDSYQHVFGDEVKYLNKQKLDKLLPANRGERLTYGGSPYYLGKTFTTDMPNLLAINEYDWILDQEENMDPERIELILRTSLIVNDIKIEMVKAHLNHDMNEFIKQKRSLYRWNQRLLKVRYDSTLFHTVSSFTNIDNLELRWFEAQLESLGEEVFKSSILSMKQEIAQGEKFYPKLADHHFYDEGKIIDFFDNYSFGENVDITSRALRYIEHNKKLEAGFDIGLMMSLIIGQPQGKYQRILKNIYTLPPNNETDLAYKFCKFFKHHQYKVLDLYYDRSGNSWKQIGRDFATSFKNAVEAMEIDGVKQNWRVNLMSEGQGTIAQSTEFMVANQIFGETNPRLPKILIDSEQCMQLKSSLLLTQQILKTDKDGNKTLHKNKSSEKLPISRLPMFSTNMSDAFKYYICRKNYIRLCKETVGSNNPYSPKMH